MMMNDDERGEGGKNAQNLMTSYVNDPLDLGYFDFFNAISVLKFGQVHSHFAYMKVHKVG